MIASTTPGAAEAWKQAALRLADLVLLGQDEMAKAVAREITAGERVTAVIMKADGTPVDIHSFRPEDFVAVPNKKEDK